MTSTDYSPGETTAALIERRFLEPELETASRGDLEALQEARILELVRSHLAPASGAAERRR